MSEQSSEPKADDVQVDTTKPAVEVGKDEDSGDGKKYEGGEIPRKASQSE